MAPDPPVGDEFFRGTVITKLESIEKSADSHSSALHEHLRDDRVAFAAVHKRMTTSEVRLACIVGGLVLGSVILQALAGSWGLMGGG